jgi:hypothetical protein
MWLKPYLKADCGVPGRRISPSGGLVMPKDWSLMADRKVVAEAAASALDETPERAAAE